MGSNFKCPRCNEVHEPTKMCPSALREALEAEKVELNRITARAFSNPLLNVTKSDLTR